VRYREEAARGLGDREDLWHAGTFAADLTAGEVMTVRAWAGDVEAVPQPGPALVGAARARARALISRAHATDEVEARLALAADQFVVAGPTVVAGYPWFGDVTLTGGSIQTRVASMPTPVRELLEEPNFVHLSTLRKDGSPRNWVVWVGLEGDRILVCTSSTQLKAQDMRRDPRVALSVTANDNPYRMAVVQGRVIEERPDHDCRFMNPIAIKYTSHPWPSPGPNRVCFVIGIDRAAERTLDFPNTPA
jgi:PPOX class probable F420-dependent enzyme